MRKRCAWANASPSLRAYHDREWGVPVHDDRKLFEFLILQGAQAGLSWETVLRKRAHYREAFHHFNPARVARYAARDVNRLLRDPGIIRNRMKIAAAIRNARKFLGIQQEFGSFDRYVWRFVGGRPVKRRRRSGGSLPARTRESEALNRDLRTRGFTFVGPTICYAFMQAAGLANDHTSDCFRRNRV